MEPKVNYALVGAFVMTLLGALVAVLIWLGQAEYGKTYEYYYVLTSESVKGLSIDSTVTYNGVNIGHVKDIMLNPDNPQEVRITVALEQGSPIKEDTVATLALRGMTGLATIDLHGGSPDSPKLTAKPGQQYPVIESTPSFLSRLDNQGKQLMDELTQVLQGIDRVMNEDNRRSVQRILQNLAAVTDSVARHSRQLEHGIVRATATLDNLAVITETMGKKLPPLMDRFDQVAGHLEEVTRTVDRTSHSIEDAVEESRPGVERFSRKTLGDVDLLVADLRELTHTLQQLAQRLERDPNALIFGRRTVPRGPGE